MVEVRVASLSEILALREAVLIAGTARDDPRFPGDEEQATVHIGAFEGEARGGACVGCATVLRRALEGEGGRQLRGMAVAEGYRGTGVGAAMLSWAEAEAARDGRASGGGGAMIWCNARVDAAGFYARHGWRVVGEPFDVAGVGPHVVMRKGLNEGEGSGGGCGDDSEGGWAGSKKPALG